MQTERTFIDDLKYQYQHGGMTIRLLMANTFVFLVIQVLSVFGRLLGPSTDSAVSNVLHSIFSLETSFSDFITHPWGIFTYFFAHFGFLHFLLNMIFLYFSGKMFEQLFDQKRLLITYLLGGIAGGLFELLAHIVIPEIQVGQTTVAGVVGASGAVMAIFTALAFYRPNINVLLFGLFPVRIIILALIFILMDFISLGNNDGTAHFAHLGGVLIGILSIQRIHSSGNIINQTQMFWDKLLKLFSREKRLKVKKGGRTAQFKTDEEYNLSAKQRQEKIDLILDKISKSGYESLTKQEKDFLFQQSKK
ncbi:MAG: rhomboid family intramembrane serine protease [Bacteroidetes bacterium]|nr:MAG: rhomboid family intramembrane serine protease [Bacteroidota bacterium]